MKNVYINMDVWMLHLLSYDPFNFARRRMKKYEPIHRKVLIYKQFITYYCSDNNRLNKTQKRVVCAFPCCAFQFGPLHVQNIPDAPQIDSHASTIPIIVLLHH
jgi:hypothetical protein